MLYPGFLLCCVAGKVREKDLVEGNRRPDAEEEWEEDAAQEDEQVGCRERWHAKATAPGLLRWVTFAWSRRSQLGFCLLSFLYRDGPC